MKLIFIVLFLVNIVFFGMEFFGNKSVVVVHPSMAEHKSSKTLQTLSERDAIGGGGGVKGVVSAAPINNSEKCELIGPYAEMLHAEYLVERLISLGVVASIKQVEIADGKNYWVYLKPEMSEKEALRRLNEIQQAKSIDSYIIPSGELANGISFGQFPSEKEAVEKAEQIRRQGYAAEIKEIPKSHNETWVEVHEKNDQNISEERWLGLLKEEKSIERRQNYCLGVAH